MRSFRNVAPPVKIMRPLKRTDSLFKESKPTFVTGAGFGLATHTVDTPATFAGITPIRTDDGSG